MFGETSTAAPRVMTAADCPSGRISSGVPFYGGKGDSTPEAVSRRISGYLDRSALQSGRLLSRIHASRTVFQTSSTRQIHFMNVAGQPTSEIVLRKHGPSDWRIDLIQECG